MGRDVRFSAWEGAPGARRGASSFSVPSGGSRKGGLALACVPSRPSALTHEVWWRGRLGNSGPAASEICVPTRDSPARGGGGGAGAGLGLWERHLSAPRAFILRPPPGGLRSPAGGSAPHHTAGPHPARASLSPVGLHARVQLRAQLLAGADSFECGPQVSNPGVGLGVSEEGRLHSPSGCPERRRAAAHGHVQKAGSSVKMSGPGM